MRRTLPLRATPAALLLCLALAGCASRVPAPEAVAAAQRALDVVSNQYRSGTVAYLNVLSAQTTVLAARRSLIDVQGRRLVAVNTLLKNVAGRWESAESYQKQ